MTLIVNTAQSADDQLMDLHAQIMARMRSPQGLTSGDMTELKVGVGIVSQSFKKEKEQEQESE